MKKVFSLSIILAVLAAAMTFSSCSKDDEDAAVITIQFNQDGKFDSGETVVATITSKDEKLTSIELWEAGGAKLKNLTIPSEKDGVYVLTIVELEDGNYTLKVASKTGANSGNFKVGKDPVVPTFPATLGGPGATAGSFLSILDGKVYTTGATVAQLKNVEIVFNGETFISAEESLNGTVNTNGQWAIIDELIPGTLFSYETSTGFEGTITIIGTSGAGDATIVNVTVAKIKMSPK